MLELIKVKYDQDIKKQLEKRFIAFDVETTGLSAVHNDLIQIAASKMHKGNIVEQFDEFFLKMDKLFKNLIHLLMQK